MKVSTLPCVGAMVAVVTVLLSTMGVSHAAEQGDSIFLKIEPSLRSRMYMRLNYISANVKTTSGDAYDVTGPVISKGDIQTYLGSGSAFASTPTAQRTFTVMSPSAYNLLGSALDDAMTSDADAGCESVRNGIGTPCGVKAKAQAMVGTPAISVGYFLDEAYSWFVEGYVLAAPLNVTVRGDGPNGINGKDIINLKLLPPTAILGRYFGNKNNVIRPFVGLGGSYAVFFDVRATDTLNNYVGGRSSGDTSVSIKNAVGFGPFAGFKAQINDEWHISLNVGKLKYKTEATITTRNTTITSDSAVLADYGANIRSAIYAGETQYNPKVRAGVTPPTGYTNGQDVGTTTALLCDLARYKLGNTDCNFGTYVRKQSTVMDNTMFMLSVGRSF